MTGYPAEDVERWVPDPPGDPQRSPFARDRARVLHSAALRRLAAKTQVVEPFGAAGGDFPRTRLTHSLEVAQVARELGQALGCDPDLVDVAGLAHDLGHPPFGHNGEAALDEVAGPVGGFEGNAQTLRVLTRLEAKTFADVDSPRRGRSVGLNLTRAALDATTKYPWPKDPADPARAVKYSVYAEDRDVFDWLRQGAPEPGSGRRSLEAQVMDWADDVAYSVHDLEDALVGGHARLDMLRDDDERAEVAAIAARGYAPDAGVDEVDLALLRLQAEPFWPAEYDGTRRSLAGLKNLTSRLINRFCAAAEAATREAFGGGPLRRYAADLVVPRETRLECAGLKAVAALYVMQRDDAAAVYDRQRDVVQGLYVALLDRAPAGLSPEFRADFLAAADDAGRARAVVDQVASLTDRSATELHRRLAG